MLLVNTNDHVSDSPVLFARGSTPKFSFRRWVWSESCGVVKTQLHISIELLWERSTQLCFYFKWSWNCLSKLQLQERWSCSCAKQARRIQTIKCQKKKKDSDLNHTKLRRCTAIFLPLPSGEDRLLRVNVWWGTSCWWRWHRRCVHRFMIIISWCVLALGQLLFLVVQFVIRPAYTYMARKTKHYKYNIYIQLHHLYCVLLHGKEIWTVQVSFFCEIARQLMF